MECSTEKSPNLTSRAYGTRRWGPVTSHPPVAPLIDSGYLLGSDGGKLDFFFEKQELETQVKLCIRC
jgi:hypothetical protein